MNANDHRNNYNIILIGIDMLRADHLGTYGYSRQTSPNIDKLAEKGLMFQNCFSQAPITGPSFMSIFTSRYPSYHGIVDNICVSANGKIHILNKAIPTMAEILKDQGYHTGAFTDGANLWGEIGFNRGFDYYSMNPKGCDMPWGKPGGSIMKNDIFYWLQERSKKKFFLFFHTYAAHQPWLAPAKYWNLFYPDYHGPLLLKPNFPDIKNRKNEFYPPGGYTKTIEQIAAGNPDDLEYFKSIYDGAIHYADHFIGELINALAALKILDKTIVVFTSDHGEQFLEHGRLSHDRFYDELLHVPLIIYAPQLKCAKKINQIVRSVDILPTVLDLLEIKPVFFLQGVSLLETLKRDLHLPALAETEAHGYALRNNEFKYIYPRYKKRNKRVDELYDLAIDPTEKNNIFLENQQTGNSMIDLFHKTLTKNAPQHYERYMKYIFVDRQ